jgi:fatty acyl-CoA reductase
MKFPTKDMMWYPSAYFTINDIWLKANEAVFHTLPAHLFDLFNSLTGKRARWVRLENVISFKKKGHSKIP